MKIMKYEITYQDESAHEESMIIEAEKAIVDTHGHLFIETSSGYASPRVHAVFKHWLRVVEVK